MDKEIRIELEEYLQEKAELEDEEKARAEEEARLEFLNSLSPEACAIADDELWII